MSKILRQGVVAADPLRILFVCMAAAGAACTEDAPETEMNAQTEDVGAVSLDLRLANGAELGSVSYSLTGNGVALSGAIDVSHSDRIAAFLGAVKAGVGYQLTLSASESAVGVTCTGNATVDVVAGQTSSVVVLLQCRTTGTTGAISVGATTNLCPTIDALLVQPASAEIGSTISFAASASDRDASPSALTYSWTTTSGTLLTANLSSSALRCTDVGTATVSLTVTDGQCTERTSVPVTCSGTSTAAARVIFTEVESNGGTPGDWAELANVGTGPADLSGYIFRDADDTHNYALPAGTTLAPGAYIVLDEAAFGFGLGAGDAVRLFRPDGVTLVDAYSWTAHATTTYGRCPSPTGDFTTTTGPTRAAANACPAVADAGVGDAGTSDAGTNDAGAGDAGSLDAGVLDGGSADAGPSVWPGPAPVTAVDPTALSTGNLSGLFAEPAQGASPMVLWAVQNSPSVLFKLVPTGAGWASDTSANWGAGKILSYPDGTGAPDSEGVTRAAYGDPGIYVATERNNSASSVSRLSVLRFDTSAPGATLQATHEWNVTSVLPAVGANLGLEAVAWLPDETLGGTFVDEQTQAAYAPASYGAHAGGVFFVGVEGTGMIHGFVLDHTTSAYQRVSSFPSGQIGVMDLAYDRDRDILWAYCDDTCGNVASAFKLDRTAGSPTRGRFVLRGVYGAPGGLPPVNNEGFAIAPESTCAAGVKSVFFADDSDTGGNSLRMGSMQCGLSL